jgi:hypothetical protein
MIFPAICPTCASASGRRIIPESPEVQTFTCGACERSWSEPAAPEPFESLSTRPSDWAMFRSWLELWERGTKEFESDEPGAKPP